MAKYRKKGKYQPNDKQGKLTLIKETNKRTKNGSIIWLCYCDCTKHKELSTEQLKNGVNSCGCTRSKVKGYASFKLVWRSYLNGAKERGFEFKLSEDEFRVITKQNCFYCGCAPSKVMDNKNNTGKYIYNGIDRLDSNKGYTLENCVPCCTQCNYAKSDYPLSEFIAWIERAYSHVYEKRLDIRVIDELSDRE